VGGGPEDRVGLRKDCGWAAIGIELIWERVGYRYFPRTHAKTFVR